MTYQVKMQVRCGLEVYVVLANGVEVGIHMSEKGARTHCLILINKSKCGL